MCVRVSKRSRGGQRVDVTAPGCPSDGFVNRGSMGGRLGAAAAHREAPWAAGCRVCEGAGASRGLGQRSSSRRHFAAAAAAPPPLGVEDAEPSMDAAAGQGG